MTQSGKALACMLGGLVFCTGIISIFAAAAENPYQSIVDRNVFSLKPPTPPPDPESLKPPAPKVTLTGIMTILGKKQALMKTPPGPPTKAGEPPREKSYMLAEGQMEDDITVVQIDEKAGTVKINNSGTTQTITFSTNEVKTATAGVPSPVGIPAPVGGGIRTIPTRSLRVPGIPAPPTGAANSGATAPAAGLAQSGVSAGGIPVGGTPAVGGLSFGGGQTPAAAASQASQDVPQRTPEENVALYELNRLKNQQLRESGVKVPPMPQHIYLRNQGSTPNPAQTGGSAPQMPPFNPTQPQLPPTQ